VFDLNVDDIMFELDIYIIVGKLVDLYLCNDEVVYVGFVCMVEK